MKRISFHAPATILPFYKEKSMQLRYELDGVQPYKLYADLKGIIPFQVFIPKEEFGTFPVASPNPSWKLYKEDGTFVFDFISPYGAFPPYNMVQSLQVANKGLWVIPNTELFPPSYPPEGSYYYTLSVDGKTFYSEVFHVPCIALNTRINKIVWKNDCDIFDTIYQPVNFPRLGDFSFKNVFAFEGELEKGNANIEEEGEENEYGQEKITLRKYSNEFILTDVVPYYVQQGLALIKTQKLTTDTFIGGSLLYSESVSSVKCKDCVVEWLDPYNFMGVMNLTIETQTIIETGCCNNFTFI